MARDVGRRAADSDEPLFVGGGRVVCGGTRAWADEREGGVVFFGWVPQLKRGPGEVATLTMQST